jgi:hypothetical protein
MVEIANIPCRVGLFPSEEKAAQAVKNLLAAGFREKQLALICPDRSKSSFAPNIHRAQSPGSHAGAEIVEGGSIGAVLGGIALIATVITTGGVALLPAIPVFIGGGAIAGIFSSLVVSEGYGEGISEYYGEAIHQGKIVVGVQVEGKDSAILLAVAEHILTAAGAEDVMPKEN